MHKTMLFNAKSRSRYDFCVSFVVSRDNGTKVGMKAQMMNIDAFRNCFFPGVDQAMKSTSIVKFTQTTLSKLAKLSLSDDFKKICFLRIAPRKENNKKKKKKKKKMMKTIKEEKDEVERDSLKAMICKFFL